MTSQLGTGGGDHGISGISRVSVFFCWDFGWKKWMGTAESFLFAPKHPDLPWICLGSLDGKNGWDTQGSNSIEVKLPNV